MEVRSGIWQPPIASDNYARDAQTWRLGAHVHTARHLLVFLLLLAFLSMVHTGPECQAVQPLLVLAGPPREERLLEEGTMLSLTCPVAGHTADCI